MERPLRRTDYHVSKNSVLKIQNYLLIAFLVLFTAVQIQVSLALYPASVPQSIYVLYSISFGNIIGGVSLFFAVWGLHHVWNMRSKAWALLPLHLFITHVVKAALAYRGSLIHVVLYNPFYWSEFFILLGFGLVANHEILTAEEKLVFTIPLSCVMFLSSLVETALILG